MSVKIDGLTLDRAPGAGFFAAPAEGGRSVLISDAAIAHMSRPRRMEADAPEGGPWSPAMVSSPTRARRFLAWCLLLECGGVNATFHPEDDFADVYDSASGRPAFAPEEAERLNRCMDAAFGQLTGEGVFEAMHAILEACGYEEKGVATK